jgi:nitroreductase
MSTAPADNRTKDALTLIRERTSVNLFDASKTVSEAEIREIIADATQAPSSYNIQHWRFVAVTDPEKKKQLQSAAYNQVKVGQASATIIVLGDLQGYEKMEQIYAPLVKNGAVTQEYASGAAQRATDTYFSNPQFARDEAIRSAALAAMTLMIAAQARGYVTGPMIGFDPEQVKRVFDISDRYVPVMLITLGYPAPGNLPRKPRLSVDEVLEFNAGREF